MLTAQEARNRVRTDKDKFEHDVDCFMTHIMTGIDKQCREGYYEYTTPWGFRNKAELDLMNEVISRILKLGYKVEETMCTTPEIDVNKIMRNEGNGETGNILPAKQLKFSW